MLEIGYVAATRKTEVDLILVDRAQADLSLDGTLVNYPVTRVASPYNGMSIDRIIGFPTTFWIIARALIAKCRDGSIVLTSTFDMLLIARFVSLFKNIRIRHQVRDLHALQLGDGLASRILKRIEKWLLRPCELLIYSAPAFLSEYYSHIYKGQSVLLENLPRMTAWRNFTVHQQQIGDFTIGYIGIIRYMNPLVNLVEAIESLAVAGNRQRVLFAGGGNVMELQKHVRTPELFDFVGRFAYTENVADLHQNVDLIYAVYDRFDRNCQIAMPTKFYEALITKIPIMVSSGTYIGDLVERMGIGIAVDGENVDSLIAALGNITGRTSWYAKARSRLRNLDIQDWYDAYNAALSTAIANETKH